MSEQELLDEENFILETRCRVCLGSGKKDVGEREKPCYLCEGSGYEPTWFGERILALLQHNFKIIQDRLGSR